MSDTSGFGSDNSPTPEPTVDSPTGQRRVTRHDIEVKAAANGGSIDWEVGGKKPNESKIKFERDSGGHEIRFDLDKDRTLKNRGLRFNCAHPIFVHDKVASCPTSGLDEQIEVRDCGYDSLRIYDKNSGAKKTLRYQLNFIEDNGSVSVCDPIIENGGGTRE